MSLSSNSSKRMFISVTDEVNAGPEIVDAINKGENLAQQSGGSAAALIVATSTSSTTNFGSLQVGDLVVHIPATAGSAAFYTVATAGTLPVAAVVGDLYIDLRSYSLPASVKSSINL